MPRKKSKPVAETLDTILDQPKVVVVASSIPDGPFPPKGMVFEPDGRGLVPVKNDTEYERFLTELAPLDELRIALAQSGGERALAFLSDIIRFSRPTAQHKGSPKLVTLAKRNGLAMDQIAEIWRSYSIAKGITTIASAAPLLASHTIGDAMSTEIVCPRCDGLGTVTHRPQPNPECETCFGLKRITRIVKSALGDEAPIEIDCPKCNTPIESKCKNCKGVGTVRKAGDAESRKQLFETLGWTRSRQPAVQVNINASHSVESVLDEIDTIIPTYTKS